MVDKKERIETSTVSWLDLLDNYQQLELALKDDDSDPEMIVSLIEQSETLFNQLKLKVETGEITLVDKEELTRSHQQSRQLIALINKEKGNILSQINALKSGKTALNAYQKPRLGMGYTEGKFLDNKQ